MFKQLLKALVVWIKTKKIQRGFRLVEKTRPMLEELKRLQQDRDVKFVWDNKSTPIYAYRSITGDPRKVRRAVALIGKLRKNLRPIQSLVQM
ncbi:MAG: hypothetical protein WC757_04610 [Candidatus Paceibacterota bacterium]